MKPKIIAIIGPTASGKTACGIRIAKEFDGEVIAIDSRTVYRGMDIGTAKPVGKRSSEPSIFEKPLIVDGVTHWGFDLVEPAAEYTVSFFQEYAQKKIKDIVKRGKLPVLVGGTGLWMDAVVDNLSFPQVEPDVELRASLEERTPEDLFDEYKMLDPEGAEKIDQFNKRRLIRALEVTIKTGKPFSEQKTKGPQLYDVLWIGMDAPMEDLETRISDRVDEMVADGLVDEVRALKDQYGCDIPAMSGIGYRELCLFFGGYMKLAQAMEEIKKNTRRFAKRQMTWWKRNDRIKWVSSSAQGVKEVQRFLG